MEQVLGEYTMAIVCYFVTVDLPKDWSNGDFSRETYWKHWHHRFATQKLLGKQKLKNDVKQHHHAALRWFEQNSSCSSGYPWNRDFMGNIYIYIYRGNMATPSSLRLFRSLRSPLDSGFTPHLHPHLRHDLEWLDIILEDVFLHML